jgi:isopentenyl-diphosphate delta-isomerase type 1
MVQNEEWFDVVDEFDHVISKARRKEVHAKGLLHRAVHILVFNQKGQVFLQKRSQLKDLCPGLWDSSCSGHVDSGEEYDTSAPRELCEELGIQPQEPLKRLFYITACKQTAMEFVWVYYLNHEGPFSLNPEEIETGHWYTPSELNTLIKENSTHFTSSFLYIWKRASEMLMPN